MVVILCPIYPRLGSAETNSPEPLRRRQNKTKQIARLCPLAKGLGKEAHFSLFPQPASGSIRLWPSSNPRPASSSSTTRTLTGGQPSLLTAAVATKLISLISTQLHKGAQFHWLLPPTNTLQHMYAHRRWPSDTR